MTRKGQIERGTKKRHEKKIILIGAEGKNETEKLYFKSLGREFSDKYVIRFAKGNSTDPIGVVNDTITDKKKECTEEGDIAFAVFDTDANQSKQKQINDALTLAEKNGITVIESTPCFEFWYLLHYRYTTRSFSNSKSVIRELKKYIPNYDKSESIYSDIRDKTKDAIENAHKLEEYFEENEMQLRGVSKNPSTDAYKIVETILEESCSK